MSMTEDIRGKGQRLEMEGEGRRTRRGRGQRGGHRQSCL